MFCPKCGEKIIKGNNFCTTCGTEISGAKSNNASADNSLNYNVCISSVIGSIMTVLITLAIMYFSDQEFVASDSMFVAYNFYVAIIFILALGTILRYCFNKRIDLISKIFACSFEVLAFFISCILIYNY